MGTPTIARAIRNPKTRFNWRVSDAVRWTICRWLELRTRVTGRKYYCESLAGESEYAITVNSDLTVSCSCQDYDGTGHLGQYITDAPVGTDRPRHGGSANSATEAASRITVVKMASRCVRNGPPSYIV